MTDKIVIGIAGPKGSGKTTLANSIKRELHKTCFRESGSVVISSFAKPMKDFLRDFFDLSEAQLTVYEAKEAIDQRYGVSPRVLMQEFGTGFVRKLIPGFWVHKMSEYIKTSDANIIIIDDIRFGDEAQLVRQHDGFVVHITGRSVKPKSMFSWLKQLLTPTHPSEKPVGIVFGDGEFRNSKEGLIHVDMYAKAVKNDCMRRCW